MYGTEIVEKVWARCAWRGIVALSLLALLAIPAEAKGPRIIKVNLPEDTRIGDMLIRSGEAEFYSYREVDGKAGTMSLAKGVLAEPSEIQTVTLPAGTVIHFGERYYHPSADLREDLEIAGLHFAKGTTLTFQTYPKQDFNDHWGTYVNGQIAKDVEFDLWGLPQAAEPVKKGLRVRKGETVTIWCDGKADSKVNVLAQHRLAFPLTVNEIELQPEEDVSYDRHGNLLSIVLKANRKIQAVNARGAKTPSSHVSFYPDGKLKTFYPVDREMYGLLVENNSWYEITLYNNGSVKTLPLSWRDQVVRSDFVASGRSHVEFWPSDDTGHGGVVKQLSLGKDETYAGIELKALSLLRFDRKGRLREAIIPRIKDGVAHQSGKMIELDEAKKIVNERYLEKPGDEKSKIEGFYDEK